MNKKLKYAIHFLPFAVFFIALSLGGKYISITEIIDILLYKITNKTIFEAKLDSVNISVLMDIRLPRIILTFLVGMSLSVSGATFQSMLKNPLVDPYILGLSSGAAFGVSAFSIMLNVLHPQISSFIFGLLAVGISYGFASRGDETSSLALVLAGVMVSAVFTSLLSIVQLIIDPLRLQSLIYWTMGSFNTASWNKIVSVFPWILISVTVIFVMRWRLNILALDDREAAFLGVNVKRDKVILIISASILATSSVSVAGIIGLVGLIIPHIVRMIFGADNRTLIPISIIVGASFLTIVDIFSRTLFTFEVPIGIFTTIIGAPFFIFLLRRKITG